jgi:hypothetical protein
LNDLDKLLKWAMLLSIITIVYNFAEGIVSIFFGAKDETLALLGFGIDSIVEVVSGIGILHMLLRMSVRSRRPAEVDGKYSKVESRDKPAYSSESVDSRQSRGSSKKADVVNDQTGRFEKTALSITGYGFYILTLGLIAGSIFNLIENAKPNTTLAGIVISSISILTMYWLMKSKLSIGRKLKSDAVIADANCTKTCFYLSFILLAANLLYEIFGIGFVDVLGTLGIAYYAFKEGKESLEKVKTGSLLCCDNEESETGLKKVNTIFKQKN